MIHYLGEIEKNVIPAHTLKQKNKVKAWKYGYDPEFDIVIISKNGTLGEIININGLRIGLPEIPDKKKILNCDKPKFEQKWHRTPMPAGLNEETQFDKRFRPYIEEEFRRREEGIFIYINGGILYMPGLSYFFYNWISLEEGYPTFRVIQNELMIYWEACKADQRCYGICYVKNRRFGWSSICDAEALYSGTVTENSHLGIISKSGDDARSMFNKLIRAFKKLPCFFIPVWDGTTTPKKELLLSEPTRKRTSKDDLKQNSEGLDTIIKYYATALNSMDGERIFRSAIDECGKWPKDVPFSTYWSIVKTSHRIGARIVGKAMVGSTVNAMSKGGSEFKEVYDDSVPMERNKNGQTPSGLYKLFVSAEFALEGFFDEFGFSIIDDPEKPIRNEFGELKTIGSNTYLDNELEALREKPEKYNEFLRQFPRTEKHAFRDEAIDCAFDLNLILEQMDYNEDELPKGTIQKGNFHWKNGIPDTEVIWKPDPNGRFWVTWHPPEEIQNKFEHKTIHGIFGKVPIAEYIGAFGCDPYNRTKTVNGRGSNGSIHLSTKFNMSGAPCNMFILEYIARPRKVELFFEDAIMAMMYYSMPMLIELSNEKFLTYLKDRGYRHYSMNRPDRAWKDLSPTEKEFGGIPAQGQKVADAQFFAVESYINDFVGRARRKNSNRQEGKMGSMYFNRSLTHWKDVDPEDRTKYDAYISSSLSLMANQKRVARKKTKEKKVLRIATYDNSGYKSVINAS